MTSPLTEVLDSKKQLRLFLDELENIAGAVKQIQPVEVEPKDVTQTAPDHNASDLHLIAVTNHDLTALSPISGDPKNQPLCTSAQSVVGNSWNTYSEGEANEVNHKSTIGALDANNGLAHTVNNWQRELQQSVKGIYIEDKGNGTVINGRLENRYDDFPNRLIETKDHMGECGRAIQNRISGVSQALYQNANMYTSSLGTVVGSVRHELVDQFANVIFGAIKDYLARKMIGATIAGALFAAIVPAAPGFVVAYKVLILGEKASKFISDIPVIGWVFDKVKSAVFKPIRGIFNGVYEQVNKLFEIFGLG